jgi:hypothetical protein
MKRSRAFYAATIFAMVALTAGFVLGAITLSNSSQNAGGNLVNGSGAVTGLSYTSTVLGATPNPVPAAPTGTAAVPQAVVVGANALCANTCTAGDFDQTISYTFTAGMTGSVMIQVVVTTTLPATGGTATLYLKQAGAPVAGTIAITWDLGNGGGTVTAVTLSDQQCTGAGGVCP